MNIMNRNQSKILLKIIFEEIEKYLLEQAPPAPPADPANPSATPPADPANPSATSKSDESDENDPKKMIDSLSKLSDEDIRKTLLAKLQNGGQKKEIEDILRYIEENKTGQDPEKSVPKNIVKVVDQLKKDFAVKTPAPEENKTNQQPPPATTAPAPVAESHTQKLIKEYLFYKRLYLRSK